jgi:5S rRNA maturation endonuclease (ribonuclease M5)
MQPTDEGDTMDKPRRLTEEERELIHFLQRMEEEYKPLVIVVEGRRDESVLRDLGVTTAMVRTQSYRTRPELLDHLSTMQEENLSVLILTDYDQEGEEIAKHLEQELHARKTRTQRRLRKRVRTLMGERLCIEDLHSLFKREDSPEPAGHTG